MTDLKNGVLLLDKPCDISSAKLLNEVKKKIKVKKIGHTGTLDPFATGLMLCTINKASKLFSFLQGAKEYEAELFLGEFKDSLDITGKTLFVDNFEKISLSHIESVFKSFLGKQLQKAPYFSALKHQGVPLYTFARQGVFIEKAPREIEIFDIKIKKIDLPSIVFSVSCSKGTYIRSLASDISKKLGTVGYLKALRRTAVSNFSVDDALSISFIQENDAQNILNNIIAMSDVLVDMPSYEADSMMKDKIKNGQQLSFDAFMQTNDIEGEFFKIVDSQNNLLSIMNLSKEKKKISYVNVFL